MNETSLLPYRRATIDVTNRPDLQNLKRGSMDPAFKSAKRVESELPSPAQDPADERSSAEESGSSDLMLQKQNKRLLRQLEEQVAKRLAIQKEYDKIKKELDLLKLENEKLRKELASYQGLCDNFKAFFWYDQHEKQGNKQGNLWKPQGHQVQRTRTQKKKKLKKHLLMESFILLL